MSALTTGPQPVGTSYQMSKTIDSPIWVYRVDFSIWFRYKLNTICGLWFKFLLIQYNKNLLCFVWEAYVRDKPHWEREQSIKYDQDNLLRLNHWSAKINLPLLGLKLGPYQGTLHLPVCIQEIIPIYEANYFVPKSRRVSRWWFCVPLNCSLP